MKPVKILFVAIVANLFMSAAIAQTADEIINKYFENTGGLQKWKDLKTRKLVGKSPTPQGEFPITLYAKAPNKVKMVLDIQGREFVAQAFDGTDAWTLNPFAGTDPVKLDEEQTKEIKDEAFEDAFINYKSKGHEVTLEGKEDVDGVPCFKIKLVKFKNNEKDDVTETHYFDAKSYVPVLLKQSARSGPAKGTEISTYLSDYRDVNGLKMAHLIEQKVQGNSVFKIIIDKITINEDLADSIFALPKK